MYKKESKNGRGFKGKKINGRQRLKHVGKDYAYEEKKCIIWEEVMNDG